MIKKEMFVFNSGLKIVLEEQGKNFIVYLLNITYGHKSNIKTYKDYNKALYNYSVRCIGL